MRAQVSDLFLRAPEEHWIAPFEPHHHAIATRRVQKLLERYLEERDSEAERFIDVVHRIGIEPFKERVYGSADQAAARRHRERAVA